MLNIEQDKKLAKVPLLASRRTQISLLLTSLALLLWCHSILYARFEIGYFGLIHGLPVTFFVALAFLTVASAILWVAKESHAKLLCLQLLLMVSALWLIPLITGGSPPYTNHTYRNIEVANYVGEGGLSSYWYLWWPGAHILAASVAKLSYINLESIVDLVPFFMQLLYLLPLYVFLKNTLGVSRSNYCWAGCWLFYLAQWCGQDYLSPQATAYFLLLTLLAVITTQTVWERGPKSFIFLSVAVLVFAALAVTHLLTALAALAILAVLCLVKRSKRAAPAVVLCLLLLISWDLTGGAHLLDKFGSQPLTSTSITEPDVPTELWVAPPEPATAPTDPGILTTDPGVMVHREVSSHFSGSESHIAVAKTRVIFSSIFALIGLAGTILVLIIRRDFKMAIPILGITLAPLVSLLLSRYYPYQILPRLYLFALPGMAYFGAMLLDMRHKIAVAAALCTLLIISLPLHLISHYGNQEFDYFPPGQVAGLHFFNDNTTGGYIAGAFPLGEAGEARYQRLRYQHLNFIRTGGQRNRLTSRILIQQGIPLYIGISRQDVAYYGWLMSGAQFIDKIEQLVNNAENCSFIYSNPDLKLYVNEE